MGDLLKIYLNLQSYVNYRELKLIKVGKRMAKHELKFY